MPRKQSVDPSLRDVLGMNVRVLRARKKLSQEQLAELSGSHQTYISAVESGRNSASVDVLERLAKALGVPAWKLLVADDGSE